jgi:type I restriction enzyme, S subunit
LKHKIISEVPSIVWSSELATSRLDATYYSANFIYNENKLSKVTTKSLKELLIKGNYGILPDSEDYLENKNSGNGIYLIRGTDLRDNFIEIDSLVKVPASYLTEKAKVEDEEVLLLIKGVTLDKEWSVSIVSGLDKPAIFNGSIFRCKFNNEVDPYFMTIYMSTDYFLKQKRRAISNTGIYYNDLDIIHSFKVVCPAPEIQSYIGNKVRKAKELREEAKRLKKEISVMFDEILKFEQKNIESKSWIVPEQIMSERLDINYYNQDYLFVRKFLDGESLQVTRLRDLVKTIYGGYPFSSDDFSSNKGIPLIRIRDINPDLIYTDVDTYLDKNKFMDKSMYLSDSETVVVGMDGNFIAGAFIEEMPKVFINQRIGIIKTYDKFMAHYLAFYINHYLGQVQLNRESVITTVAHISLRDIENILIVLPDNKTLEEISTKLYKACHNLYMSKKFIGEAKQDVEDLIEGKFDESKISEGV